MKLDIHYLLSLKNSKYLIIALGSLFALLIILECTSLFFSIQTESMTPFTEQQHTAPSQQRVLDDLMHSSLFGVYIPNDLNSKQIKQSMLNVTLVGILLGNASDSQVILRFANNEEKNYKVNDTIPGGALIKKITADGILVEHDGTLERVSFPKEALTFEPVPKPLRSE